MNIDTLGFLVSFTLMYSILLWFIIGHKGWIKTKVVLVLLMTFLTILNWSSVNNMLGWPTNKELPDKFQILWIVIQEPSKKDSSNKGGIFLTIKYNHKDDSFSLFNKRNINDPRLFSMPYTQKGHEQGLKTLKKLKKGQKVFATRDKPKQGKGKDGEAVKDGKAGIDGAKYNYRIKGEDMYYELPPQKRPRKN